MIPLELAVDDAIHRIKNAYEVSKGNIYLSFSGGKDSTILAKLIQLANLPIDIPFVFADTGLELQATLDFVEAFDYPNKVTIKPIKSMTYITRNNGIPICSKSKSGFLGTWQKQVKQGVDPLKVVSCTRLLGISGNGADRLANKHFHLIHPDHEYQISSRCCVHLKKKPFTRYKKASGNSDVILGIRLTEGGIRTSQYKSCTITRKKKDGSEQNVFMPIIDWSDDLCDEFITTYNVEISKAYTQYGFKRSGCCGCPYSKELNSDLEILHKYEPLKYKAVMFYFKDAYVDQGIELPLIPPIPLILKNVLKY